MNIIIKIMLSLVVLSGCFGMFFAFSASPRIDGLHKSVIDSKAMTELKQGEIDKTKAELDVTKINLEAKNQETTNLNARVLSSEKMVAIKTAEAEQNANATKDSASKAQEYNELLVKYNLDQEKLNAMAALQSDLGLYKELIFAGKKAPDAKTIQALLKELETNRKPVSTNIIKEIAVVVQKSGKVTNVDPKYGFIQINFSSNDAPVNSVLKVKRNGAFIGQIKVVRNIGSFTYCLVDKPNTSGVVTLGDLVEKVQ